MFGENYEEYKMYDDTTNKIENHFKEILLLIGEDPNREGLIDTPKRIAKMYSELFSSYKTPIPTITVFNNGSDGIRYSQMITDTGTFNSMCEHHMIPFMGKYYFAYIANENGKILGLSKVARIVDYYSARLQIQERLTNQIVDCLWNSLCHENSKLNPIGMGLIMKAEHLCKTIRGVKKQGCMKTVNLKGKFLTDEKARQVFFDMCDIK